MTFSQVLCPANELHLEYTLVCGQTFRWRLDAEGWWTCLLPVTDAITGTQTHQLVRVRQDDAQVVCETAPQVEAFALVRDYFRLDVNLAALARQFSLADAHIAPALAAFSGLRVLRQDPSECLFSFLCTSAAPLHRIRRSIDGMCREYGEMFPGGEVAGLTHWGFPAVNRLAEADVLALRALGLGYRARYIKGAAQMVMENGGAGWLLGLRQNPYAEAKAALLTLPGVGEKIADCVCLFSLDKDAAIPVDTHIRQIAQRAYLPGETGALTKAAYARIGDCLRERFGPYAGWAQQYLFFADLYLKNQWAAYTALYQPFGEPIQPLKKDPRKFGPS